jgi:hypothetical protein
MARNAAAVALFNTPAPITVVTAYNSGDIDVSAFARISVDVDITVLTGTTPTWTVIVERKDANGKYYPLFTSTAHSAAATDNVDIGPGLTAATAGNLNRVDSLTGQTIRVRATPGGTVATVSFTVSVIGESV